MNKRVADSSNNRDNNQYINALLQKYALPAVIGLALLIITFGLIIRFQTAAAVSSVNLGPVAEATPTPQPTPTPVVTESPAAPETEAPTPTPETTTAPPQTPTPAPTQTKTPTPTQTKTPTPTQTKTPANNAPVIVVDAGHGTPDCGTIGSQLGTYEKDINLPIAKMLEELLISAGYRVVMTRTGDEAHSGVKVADWAVRYRITLNCKADYLISIHQNAFEDKSVKGPEVYYHPNNNDTETLRLAQSVQDSLDRGLSIQKSRGIRSKSLMVLTFIPHSVLVECGFLSNAEEEAKLITTEYQLRVANAIFEGIVDFFEKG